MNDRVARLEEEIRRHNALYHSGDIPEIDDADFDLLVDELRNLHPRSEVLKEVGAEPLSNTGWEKAKHDFFVGSLSKVHTKSDLEKWAAQYPGAAFNGSHKLDGISIVVYYVDGKATRAITRGDGEIGEDIFLNVREMRGFYLYIKDFSGSIRGEITLSHDDFKQYFPEKENPRNAAAGAAKKRGGDRTHLLQLSFYDVRGLEKDLSPSDKLAWLRMHGLAVPPHLALYTIDGIWEFFKADEARRATLGYDIDGYVIQVDHATDYGVNSENRPKGAIALKFPPCAVVTTLERISWEISSAGRITPVGEVTPTPMYGITLRRVSLHNPEFLVSHEVTVGSRIEVERAGDVIPYLRAVVERKGKFWLIKDANPADGSWIDGKRFNDYKHCINLAAIQFPKDCPECHGPIEMHGAYLECVSPTCPSKVRGRVQRWVDALDIKNVGEGLIGDLVKAGYVKTPADLYRVTLEQVSTIDRKGASHYEKMRTGLEARMVVTLPEFLGALGIPHAAASTWKKVVNTGYSTLERVLAITPQQFLTVPRISAAYVQPIWEELRGLHEQIADLQSVGVKIKVPVTGGKLSGQSFVFTGACGVALDGKRLTREMLERMVEEHGGKVGSVNKYLTALVTGDSESTSAKMTKAKTLGIPIITPEEFLKRVGA